MKPRATELPTHHRPSLRTVDTRTDLAMHTNTCHETCNPGGSHSARNCVHQGQGQAKRVSTLKCSASERKPRSSAQKRLDRTTQRHGQMILRTKSKRKSTYSRKGALTTARPLLANGRLTGETCAKNFADTCYTASGSRAESQPQPTKLIIGAE